MTKKQRYLTDCNRNLSTYLFNLGLIFATYEIHFCSNEADDSPSFHSILIQN